MMCINPHNGIPCGHCMACRLNKQNEKKLRICHEAEYYDKACFLTVTYSDEHLHKTVGGIPTLYKRDAQLFIKRIRRLVEPDRIKYFLCGEYGDMTQRPHYHVILLGVDMHDTRLFKIVRRFKNECWCECKAWKENGDFIGQCTVAPFTEARAAYVAKYCVKKWSGKGAEDYYKGREPEFCLTSQGLGLQWLNEHKSLLLNDGFVRVKKKRVPLPRYYEEKLFPKDTYRNIDWRAYKEAKGQESFEKMKEFSGTQDKESFEKWQDEVRKQTALFMATRLQRKKGVNNV